MEILLFGVTKDIVGKQKLILPVNEHIGTVADLKNWLVEKYPKVKKLSSLAVAVDNEYAGDDMQLNANSEVALLPPVSGG